MDEKERARALDLALSQIEKQFGKGSILRLGSKDAIVPVAAISTGSISLDAATGVGTANAGVPRKARRISAAQSHSPARCILRILRLRRSRFSALMWVM